MEGINIAHRWRRLFAFAIDNLMIVTCVFAITVHGGKVEGNRRVIYGNRLGRDLVFDFIRPFNPNGLGIIFINSGSWKSDPEDVNLFFLDHCCVEAIASLLFRTCLNRKQIFHKSLLTSCKGLNSSDNTHQNKELPLTVWE